MFANCQIVTQPRSIRHSPGPSRIWHSAVQPVGRELLRLVFLAGLSLLSACASLPDARLVSTPAGKHSYVLAGQGSPTVILEAGLGDGKESWAPVYEQIARFSQVYAYDRSGYGASRSRNTSRDGATIAHELRAQLQAAGLAPPYVMVGHSIGGTYLELYARTYPQDVAGMVFVDSRHADFTRQCRLAGARQCQPPSLLAALLPGHVRRELDAGEMTMAEVRSAGTFPEVPVAVLTSGKKTMEGARFREVWLDTQKALASLSPDATHTVCQRCGHYIHRDDPELVVGAVKDVVQRARD